MRRSLVMITTAVLVSTTVLVRADDLVLSRFSDFLSSLRQQSGIPGLAATIVSTTDVQWEGTYGQQDVERNIGVFGSTPFPIDASTQLLVASRVLRCVEEGRLSLDDRIGRYVPNSPDAGATVRDILSHTTTTGDDVKFSYRPDRLAPLAAVIAACTGDTFSGAMISLLEKILMYDSVPGSDGTTWLPPSADPGGAVAQRYTAVLGRMATPYTVDANRKATPSRYPPSSLTPGGGLISTVRDMAQFDLAIKKGVLLQAESLALAWTTPVDRSGQHLPHGLGWFVQTYNGERIVWQFGVADNGSSSMILTAPFRGLTLILLANSNGLARPFSLESGDVTVSPFARLFLEVFVR